ncbi:cyclin-J-like protein [Sitophilus oryzae]|uniref:Cyclin-J-like protein n=1 Tax=Sitophilus oryzae TaxID=7048 RepID=A0A6J2Y7A9_SITOR|nr:cyclin-J-like protein [Sitophilus oryzae]
MNRLMNRESPFYLHGEIQDHMSDYRDCFKQVIKQREVLQMPFFHASTQLSYRNSLVNHMRQICINKKLTHCTLHLAVYLMDSFMDCHNIIPEKTLLLANVCLLIAAKFEENSKNIPKIAELNFTVHNRYNIKEYGRFEVMILDYFSWYVMFPTPAHYTHYYVQAAISKEDLLLTEERMRTLIYKLHDSIVEYLNQIIDNIHYMQDFKPSLLAATVIAASRMDCNLPVWTQQLEELTEYTSTDISRPLCTLLMNKLNRDMTYPVNLMCTNNINYCTSCNITYCPHCQFLQKF